MTQEKDIILHSMVMDKVVDIVQEHGLKLEVIKIKFPKPCHSKILFPSTEEGYHSMMKALAEIHLAEMEYLKSEAKKTEYITGLTRKLKLKRLREKE
ncbi:MAG: hypothetical protein A3F72_01720 [Bacteroidetes bacterium RIFCSPLOWO2_12_FULL_35_15]|nr:MAG: hypothetical protein A3F72_01720 [Bacteroidetes bacterium RIFCSPLOWO2_12_FULL_35_15]